ncbi:hypothetical protein HAV38_08390 [Glaciimonas immobilis]|nr:hypothetical protein HAV38_08390 [Glaciimonas immobilis]
MQCSCMLVALCRCFIGHGGMCRLLEGPTYNVTKENDMLCITLGLDVQGGWTEPTMNGEKISGEKHAVSMLLTIWLSHLIGNEIDHAAVAALIHLIDFELEPYGLSLALDDDPLQSLPFEESLEVYRSQQQACRQDHATFGPANPIWQPLERMSSWGLLLELIAQVSPLLHSLPSLSPANPADFIALVHAVFGRGLVYAGHTDHGESGAIKLPILSITPIDLGKPAEAVRFRPLFSMSMPGAGCEFQLSEKFIPLNRNSATEIKIHTAPALWRTEVCRDPLSFIFDGGSASTNASKPESGALHIAAAIDHNGFGNHKIKLRFADRQTAEGDQDLPPLWLKGKSDGAHLIVQIGENSFGSDRIFFENKIDATTPSAVASPSPSPISNRLSLPERGLEAIFPAQVVINSPAVAAAPTHINNAPVFSGIGEFSSNLLANVDHEFERATQRLGAALFSRFWVNGQTVKTKSESSTQVRVEPNPYRTAYLAIFYNLETAPTLKLHAIPSTSQRYAAILNDVYTEERNEFFALRDQGDLLSAESILVMYATRIKNFKRELTELRTSKIAPAGLIEILEVKIKTVKKRHDSQFQLQKDMAVLVSQARGKLRQFTLLQPLSLVQSRVEAIRQFIVTYELADPDVTAATSDHVLLRFANECYDPTSATYSRSVSKRLAELEALNYYFIAKVKQLHLSINDPDLIDKFISVHYAVLDVETIHRFHRRQFEKTNNPGIPVLSPRAQVGLRRYYEQLNEYLQNHLTGHAASIAQQISIGINALDLERPYRSVIGLDITYRDDGVPLRGGAPNIIRRPVTGDNRIYLIKGDSGTIYASSTFGRALVIEDASALINDTQFEALARRDLWPQRVISIPALGNLLWPNNSPLPKNKRLEIRAPWRYSLPAGVSLGAFLRSDQRLLLRQFITLFREQNMDRAWPEELASWMPFFDVIQRSHYDPHYTPEFKELFFDSLDLVITLASIGIPIFKLGSAGLRATNGAVKAARLAGIGGAGLRKIIFNAARPYLKKSALTAIKEVAGFILPPIDWGRTLANIGPKILRHTGIIKPAGIKRINVSKNKFKLSERIRQHRRKNKQRRLRHQQNRARNRCKRMEGAACSLITGHMDEKNFSYEYTLAAGRDEDKWIATLLALVEYPKKWVGGKAVLSRKFSRDYKTEFSRLPVAEQEAVRGWSYLPLQERYGTSFGREHIQGFSKNSFYINKGLRGDWPLTPELKTAAINLSSALKKLPAPPGKTVLLRVSDVGAAYSKNLAIGDTVTNHPTFMSASADGNMLETALHYEKLYGVGKALAVYHIKAKSAKPLVKRTASQAGEENEWLFCPGAFFVVTSITKVRKLTNGLPYGKEINVIGLKEIDKPPGITEAKNIHTEQSVSLEDILVE